MTARQRVIWAAVCAAGTVRPAPAQAIVPTDLADELSAIVAEARTARVGLVVRDARSGELLFAHDADEPLKPASVLKLLVTAAALERFGADFRYRTPFVFDPDRGVLMVRGSGDPAIGDPRLQRRAGAAPRGALDDVLARLLPHLHRRPVERIALDDSLFDEPWRHPDWPAAQHEAWYQAPAGALNLNDNCLDGQVQVRDGRIELELRPALPPEFLRERLTIGRRPTVRLTRPLDSDIFELRGVVSERPCPLGPTSCRRPTVFFGQALLQALRDAGVEVRGPVVRQRLDPQALETAPLRVVHETPLTDVLWRANAFSQNLFAECLLKTLAAYEPDGRASGRAGTFAEGVAVLRETLAGVGIDLRGAVLRDGSGLSHLNRLTPAQVCELLVLMRRHPLADVFLSSLARPGEEGSMRRRFRWLRGRLVGKTGTLRGVAALAGYVRRTDGQELAFALLINWPDDNSPAQGESNLPDRIVGALAGSPR